MKHIVLSLTVALAASAASFAAAEDSTSPDEQTLEQSAGEIDRDAAQPEGRRTVESRLKSEYKVDDARIQSLRDQKLGYGEISIALALASKLPGGITDANVAAIMAERNGPPKMGWGQIAKAHGTTVRPLIGRGRNADAAAPKHEKTEKAREKAERRERTERAERRERHEKHPRMERPEHPKR